MELKTPALAFDGCINNRDIPVLSIGSHSVFSQRNHLVARYRALATVHDVEVVLHGATGLLLEDIISWLQCAAEKTALYQDTVCAVEMDPVSEGFHVDLAAYETGVFGTGNRHERVLVETTKVRASLAVEVRIPVRNGTLDHKRAVQKSIVVVADLKLVFGYAIVRIFIVDNISEISSLKRVFGTVYVPGVGNVNPAGQPVLDGYRRIEYHAAQVEIVV